MNRLSVANGIPTRSRRCLTARPKWTRSLQPADHSRGRLSTAILRANCHLQQYYDGLFPSNVIKIEQRRCFFLDALPTVLLPPVAFTILLVALWVYKCMMMILFQNKIIYMPYIPPFSRSEKIEDYAAVCKPVEWNSIDLPSLDGTKLAVCMGSVSAQKQNDDHKQHIVICYFQGNAGSLPSRLPGLSSILKRVIELEAEKTNPKTLYTMVALSYRGYWTSSGHASQKGIELDSKALMQWVNEQHSPRGIDTRIILWGQSIGSGIAATAAAHEGSLSDAQRLEISGIVLETPFSSIRSMLSTIYPQKWLPYGYLWPFLWNHWDSIAALRRIAQQIDLPRILVLAAERDEIVPMSETDKLESLCKEVGLDVVRKTVKGALHNEATARRAGREAITDFISDIADR